MSKKAEARRELKSARSHVEWATREIKFAFSVRHDDWLKGSVYDPANFKHWVRQYRLACRRLAKAATDYLANYKA